MGKIIFILYLIVLIVLVVVILTIIQGLVRGAPYIPTNRKIIQRMLKLAKLKKGERLIDLGSGDGRILIIAAKQFGAQAFGVEITWFYFCWSRIKIFLLGLKSKAKVVQGDIFYTDLSQADVVIMYLLQDTNQKLWAKLDQELKPGARVVSHYFTFHNWQPEAIDKDYNLYLYVKKNN